MSKKDIWISDLTHTAQGISANTFPLGASCVFTYAKNQLGTDFNFKLGELTILENPFPSTKEVALFPPIR